MKAAVLALCAALAGCGAVVKASSPRSVMIGADTPSQAMTAGESECGKYSRHAQLRARDGFSYTFDCVE